jgi:hypothetical protein
MASAYDREAWRASVRNGRIPRDKLAEIWPPQHDPDLGAPALMHPEAALAMGALLRQAWEDGATNLRVKYSYRDFATQQHKYELYKGPDHNIGTDDDGNLAAFPGTSNHGWGVSVDFTGLDEDEVNWLRRHSFRYGFLNDVDSENWHYTYQEHVWKGEELTEDERKMLMWLKGFREATTERLGGLDNGEAIGGRVASAVEHLSTPHRDVDLSELATAGHVHREGTTGPPIDERGREHVHRELRTGPAVEP